MHAQIKRTTSSTTQEQIAKFVAHADADGSGTIDISEFMAKFDVPDYGKAPGHYTQGGGAIMNRARLGAEQEVGMAEVAGARRALEASAYRAEGKASAPGPRVPRWRVLMRHVTAALEGTSTGFIEQTGAEDLPALRLQRGRAHHRRRVQSARTRPSLKP
jgi:hypothetical protein